MIGISKLYCGTTEPSDVLRYGRHSANLPAHLLQFSRDKKPVVVWNVSQRCNLRCVHCYSASGSSTAADELTPREGRDLIEDLAAFGVPVVLFSGGEPLMRPDLMDMVSLATNRGMRAVISTNGTLITPSVARDLQRTGLSYAGVSIDGTGETNDRFRGVRGAFDQALQGIRNCRTAGIRVGLRFTINKRNSAEIPDIFRLLEAEDIPRVCFYHLVYSGRGSALVEEDLSHAHTRAVVDEIIDRTAELHSRGREVEVLTVDNHADGIYLYLRMVREGARRAPLVRELLQMNGGNSSGHGIGCVSWNGDIYADQFWRHHCFGNVRSQKFSQVWEAPQDPLLRHLKDKVAHLTGRCAGCCWRELCGGNFRARAEAVSGDLWAPDPACYLTDAEIGLDSPPEAQRHAAAH